MLTHVVGHRCCSVEVGCGTGDVILSLAADFKHSLGLDINDGFLAYAERQTPEELKEKVRTAHDRSARPLA